MKTMKIMTTMGIPCDFTWCTLAEMTTYPQFVPLVQKLDGPFVPVVFK